MANPSSARASAAPILALPESGSGDPKASHRPPRLRPTPPLFSQQDCDLAVRGPTPDLPPASPSERETAGGSRNLHLIEAQAIIAHA